MSWKVSSVATEMSIQQLEEFLASKRLAAKQNKLFAEIGTVTGLPAANQVSNCGIDITDAVGCFLYLDISIDTGAQSTLECLA